MEEKTIIAIEIGSSKVRGAIGTCSPSGVLTVQSVDEEPMQEWVRYGAVSNVEEVATLVNRIIRKIENRVSPRKVKSVYVAMGGRSFCSLPREVTNQFADEVEITDEVLSRLAADAAVSPYVDRELLQVVPREYMVDKAVVSRPKGTVGRSIRMSANLITCRPQTKRNIDRLFAEKLKLDIAGYKVRQLALADVVLTTDEKRLGCMLVDFGAETTTVSVYKNGRLQYLATLPIGSRNITRDIMKLNYVEEKAEDIKCTVGNASGTAPQSVPFSGTDYSEVNNYVSHRAGEIIANIREQLKYAGFSIQDLPRGIVIVGGGARLAGFNERLAATLAMPIRTGSVNLAEVRIPDSRISPTDACDVISVLYRAAVDGAADCLTVPVEPEPVPEPEPEPEPQPVVDVVEVEPQRRNKKGPGFWGSIRERMVNLMTETDDDDDDSELRDDI